MEETLLQVSHLIYPALIYNGNSAPPQNIHFIQKSLTPDLAPEPITKRSCSPVAESRHRSPPVLSPSTDPESERTNLSAD